MINLQNYTKQELIILKKEIEEIINKMNLEIDEIEFELLSLELNLFPILRLNAV